MLVKIKRRKFMTENERLRKLLWLTHYNHFQHLYGDDSELQCAECLIDFKRDGIEVIEARLQSTIEKGK